MGPLHLTQAEFEHILRVSKRVLINCLEPAVDIQAFLVARLHPEHPDTAAKIAGFNEAEIRALWEQISLACQAGLESALLN